MELPKQLLIVLAFLMMLAIGFIVFASKAPQEGNESLSGLFIKASNVPYYPTTITYGTLIDCLVKYESNGNPEAVGDNGKARGVLQFHKPTFKMYCVDRYGYFLSDYTDTEVQKACADEMLRDNLKKNIRHWTVYPNCI